MAHLLLGFLLPPTENIPFIDSWSYSWTAKALAERGRWELAGWSDMSLVAHVAWGALLARFLGFSFAALNLSTYVLSPLCLAACYYILRGQGVAEGLALASALVLAGNPIFFLLSRTFMTDVPFLAWLSLSTWAYARGLERDDPGQVFLGSLFATLALAIRQNGVLVALAAGTSLLLVYGRRMGAKRTLAAIALPLATMGGFFLAWRGIALTSNPFDQMASPRELAWFVREAWEGSAGWGPARSVAFVLEGGGYLLLVALKLFLYGGLFLLPLTLPGFLVALREGWLRRAGRKFILWGSLLALGTAVLAFQAWDVPHLGPRRAMPYLRDLITPFGVGGDAEWLLGERVPLLPEPFWWAATALSLLSAAMLLAALHERVAALWASRKKAWWAGGEAPELFIYLAAGWQLAFFLAVDISGEVFDRHTLVFFLPLGLAYLKSLGGKLSARWGMALLLAAYLVYSLLATSHYFAWNRARWGAAEGLVEKGAAPLEVEGGFEWDGWHSVQARAQGQNPAEVRLLPPLVPWYYLLFPEMSPRYVISFSPLPGCAIREEVSYRSFLPWRGESLFILECLPP